MKCFRKTSHPRNANEPQGWEETDVCDTLNVFDNAEARTPILVCYKETGFADYKEGVATLKSSGGCIGGGVGQRVLNCLYQDTVGSLCQVDYKGVGSQYVEEGKLLCAVDCYNIETGDVFKTMTSGRNDKNNIPCVVIDMGGGKSSCSFSNKLSPTLSTTNQGEPVVAHKCFNISPCESNCMKSKNPHSGIQEINTSRTLDTQGGNPACNQGGTMVVGFYPQMKAESMTPMEEKSPCLCNGTNPGFQNGVIKKMEERYIVRRLTPLGCERLQGFPDGWTDIGEWYDSKGKKRKDADSPRYKALGNSIALPFWQWMIDNMAEFLPQDATMGSLFDGIGGFPLCWERTHGKGTAKWASEIEEFPIAVTKLRFGDE